MPIAVKPALQLVYHSSTQKRTWIILKPNACVEGFLVLIVPLWEDGFECESNCTCNRFCEGVMRSSGSQ